MDLSDMVDEAYETARSKGWFEDPVNIPELFALMHSEVSEALEDYRVGYPPTLTFFQPSGDGKPCGIPIELADIVIRVASFCGHFGIDLDTAVRRKMEYNKTRPPKHGGKLI